MSIDCYRPKSIVAGNALWLAMAIDGHALRSIVAANGHPWTGVAINGG